MMRRFFTLLLALAIIPAVGMAQSNRGAVALQTATPGTAQTGSTNVLGNQTITASAGGAIWTRGSISEAITLSTGGATTDSSADLLPANSVILGVACRVTTTITTATDWAVGDGTTAARFSAANATLTAGTASVGLQHLKGGISTDATGPVQVSATKLRITTTGTPGAGAIRCTVFYDQFVAPTS